MAHSLNPYDTCPCGSGKKFKFCCTAYYDLVDRALALQQNGQHETCLKTVEELTSKHGTLAPVWGYAAQVFFNEGKPDEAEKALEKGFAIDPNFAMGFFLRGLFRQNEGELIGALMLFRKAAEAYHPDAKDQLAYVHEILARSEILLNRPVASRAALARAVQFAPSDAELKQQFEGLFGPQSRMPTVVRREYRFRPTMRPLPEGAATGRLSDARKAYEQLTTDGPNDPAGWFNLGLVRAWLGEQPLAVEALNRSIELEMDDARAEEAAALAEVLKCGSGMENDTDHLEYRCYYPIRDGQAVTQLIQVWSQEGRLFGAQLDEERGSFSSMIVEELPSLVDTGTSMAKVLASLNIGGGVMRIWGSDEAAVQKIGIEVKDRLNLAVGEASTGTAPANFAEVISQAIAYPLRSKDPVEAEAKVRDYARHYFEDVWANRPLRALGGATPIDAAGSKLMRKRLLGIIKFLDDCVRSAAPARRRGEQLEFMEVYDFNQLRHKLGLGDAPVATDAPTGEIRSFSTMSAADLALVPLSELSVSELADGMRAAMKLDARELAVAYAKAAVARPADASYPDRFPFALAIANSLSAAQDTSGAIQTLANGAVYDREHNEGKRAADYGRQTGKTYARAGEVAKAAEAYRAVIEANPDDPRNYVDAAETMLRVKDKTLAVEFAEKGLAKAQTIGNRDLEGACQELLQAARR